MGTYIKLREKYHAKETTLGEPVNGKKITIYKDKWTKIEKVTKQMFRLRKHIDIHEGDGPPKKAEKVESKGSEMPSTRATETKTEKKNPKPETKAKGKTTKTSKKK